MANDNVFFIVRCSVCTVEVVRIGAETAISPGACWPSESKVTENNGDSIWRISKIDFGGVLDLILGNLAYSLEGTLWIMWLRMQAEDAQ